MRESCCAAIRASSHPLTVKFVASANSFAPCCKASCSCVIVASTGGSGFPTGVCEMSKYRCSSHHSQSSPLLAVDSVRTAMGSLLSLCSAASRRRSALRISPDESSSAQANGVLLLTMIGLSKTLVSHTRAPACCNAYTPCQRMQPSGSALSG